MAGVKRSFEVMLDRAQPNHHYRYNDHRDGSEPRKQRASSPPDLNDTATQTPSMASPPLAGKIPDFGADASIVLVGIRGAGKSTLAVIGSSAMNRKVVDVETSFQRSCGVSSAAYRKEHGIQACHRQQAKIMQEILERHRTGCVIVCSWMESRAQALLRDFAATNPVVHVVRETDAIQEHLKIPDRAKMHNLLSVSHTIYRTCSNLEFFNVSERQYANTELYSSEYLLDRPLPPYLTLKNAERHFLKFLSLIYPPGTIPYIESAFPLATAVIEDRQFTYALSVPLVDILEPEFDLESHIAGVDIVQVVVGGVSIAEAAASSSSDSVSNLTGQITRAIGIARRSTVLPLAVHIDLPEAASDELVRLYIELIKHAVRLAAEVVIIDLRLAESDFSSLVGMKGRSKVIGEFFIARDPPSWDSPTWRDLYEKASHVGCDMVRLLRPAASMNDNFEVGRFRNSVKSLSCRRIPLIAYNTGLLGRNSACYNPILTTVVPRSPSHIEREYLPTDHCLTSTAATEALCSSFVYDKMKLYVFGMNVGYSASPAMHNSALRACGLSHKYRPQSADSLRSIKHLIDDPYFGGASVGLPFKVEVITLIHSLSRHAQAIGAVNTLIPVRQLNADGSLPQDGEFFNGMGRAGPVKALYGENTDWVGIRDCIRRGLSPANAVRQSTCGLIIGAGGMARAAVYSMLQVGVQNITIYNRTVSNAEKMAEHFTQLLEKPDFQSLGAGKRTRFHVIRELSVSWPSEFNVPTIIISCIPTHRIGSTPAPQFRVPEEWLASRTGGVIVELGYKSLDTPLLAQAAEGASRGWVSMTGLDLLPVQGFAQFELFTGKRAPRNVMRQGLARAYRSRKGYPQAELESGLPSEAEGEGDR